MKRFLWLPVFLLIFLAGCVQYNEEMWLNKDGSGSMHMVLGVASSYDNTEYLARYAKAPGIHIVSVSTYSKQDMKFYDIDMKFDSIADFNRLSDEEGLANFFGKIYLQQDKKRIVRYKRVISLGNPEINDEDTMADVFQNIFTANKVWSYTFHAPYPILVANATQENVNIKQNTVKWRYEISYLWNRNQSMEVQMQKPISIYIYIAIGIGLLLSLLIWIFRHRSHRKHHV